LSQAGIVNVSGGGVVTETLTGNDGTIVTASGNNINVVGHGVAASGVSTAGNIYTTGSGSTLTINSTEAQFLTNYTAIATANSPYTVLASDYYISVSTAGAVTILLPNAPTTNRMFIIKDRTGGAAANNISVTTVGGSVTIDGVTTYTMNVNYAAITLMFNGTSYEVF
jgi:hypothetical protein